VTVDGWQWGTHAAGSVNVVKRGSEALARDAVRACPGVLQLCRRCPPGSWQLLVSPPSQGEAAPFSSADPGAQVVRDALSAIRADMADCPLDEVLDRIEADLPGMVAERLNRRPWT